MFRKLKNGKVVFITVAMTAKQPWAHGFNLESPTLRMKTYRADRLAFDVPTDEEVARHLKDKKHYQLEKDGAHHPAYVTKNRFKRVTDAAQRTMRAAA